MASRKLHLKSGKLNIRDLTGMKFGRLVAIGCVGTRRGRWKCRCDCGCEKVLRRHILLDGITQSCGCLRRDRAAASRKTHGLSQTPSYSSWIAMIRRCTDPTQSFFARYGGRGISICARWMKFENFLADMGHRPAGTTIDRIDNNGNYEPGNCRWATRKEQSRNLSVNRIISFRGESLCLTAWAERIGFAPRVLTKRFKCGWSVEKALTTPIATH